MSATRVTDERVRAVALRFRDQLDAAVQIADEAGEDRARVFDGLAGDAVRTTRQEAEAAYGTEEGMRIVKEALMLFARAMKLALEHVPAD
jgi:hypothetical protein